MPVEPPPPVLHPQGRTDLRVTGRTDTPVLFEGQGITLVSTAVGGTPPYLFRWNQNAGPVDLVLTDPTSATVTIGPVTTPGRYVFRVIAVDRREQRATDFVIIDVLSTVQASAPKLAVVGEPVGLSSSIEMDVGQASFLWEVVRGSATIDDPSSSSPALMATMGETVEVRLTVELPSVGGEPMITTRSFEIVTVDNLKPQVRIETNLGPFTIELDGRAAPLHTANFLSYVDDGFYDGLLFHRNVCTNNPDTGACDPFVLQGGGFKRVGGELVLQDATRDPVVSEADNGLSNGVLHSVALALSGGNPDSGTTQFFINLADNSFLDDQGFTVFGMVVDGTDVVDTIVAGERIDNPIIPGEVSLPAQDVMMERVVRISPSP